MALGAVEVSPLEMAQAYAPFANGGFLARGYGIERIRTASGKVLYDHGVDKGERKAVIGSPALQYMNQMMRQVIVGGTGTRARVPGYDIAGKTGTTSDYRDAWFVGYTGGFVAAVWVGKDDNTPMRRVTGGGAPAVIWRDFMTAALPRLKTEAIPGGVITPPPAEAINPDPIVDLIDGGGAPPSAADRAPGEKAPAEEIPF
jgi:penicillin-binding protein 1A